MEKPNAPARALRFGGCWVDLRAGELRKNGQKIRLPEQPFQILALLLERPGEVVTRDELRQKLWPADTFVDFDHGLNNAINRLREVLNDSAENPRYIETLPRRGYRFIHPVESTVTEIRAPVAWWRARWVVSLFGLAALIAVALAINVGGMREKVFGLDVGPIESVAVLPCKNLTGDPGQEFLADGLTDVLTTHLAQVKSLIVPSITSAMYFKGERKKLPEIAHQLKVQAVVEPSVQRSGPRLLLNFQLIHAPTDRHLWAKSYEVDPKNVQSLLPTVARDILETIKVKVTSEETSRLSRTRATTPEAYEAYLRGRSHQQSGTQHGRTRAEEFFKKAVELDPNYAEAYSRLALLYAHGGAFLAGGDLATRAKTREYARKALDLDPQSAEAYTALAWADLSDWDWVGSEQNFKRAIELSPNFVTVHVWYSEFLAAMRRFDEALVQSDRARQLAPLQPVTLGHAAVAYWQSGRTDAAQVFFQEIVDLDPNYWFGHHLLALGHLQKGRYQEAIAAIQKSMALREASPNPAGSPFGGWRNLGVLAYANAKAGQRAEALKIVRDLERGQKEGRIRAQGALAIAHVGLGNHKRALDWLETWYELHGAGLYAINADPFFEPLHSDARFQELIRLIGLPPERLPPAKRQ